MTFETGGLGDIIIDSDLIKGCEVDGNLDELGLKKTDISACEKLPLVELILFMNSLHGFPQDYKKEKN